MPSKKKAEEEKRKMSASNRQSRLRGEKSARNFDQQRARPGKKIIPHREKSAKRRKSPSPPPSYPRPHLQPHPHASPQNKRRHPPSDAVFANSSQTFHFPLKPLHIWSFCVSQRKPPSPIGSPRSPIRILRVTAPGNREADAPSPAPTTVCSLPGWDGCCPSCRASAAHR